MLAPVGWQEGVGVHTRLVAKRVLQQGEETADFREVLLLSVFNGGLSKIVPRTYLGFTRFIRPRRSYQPMLGDFQFVVVLVFPAGVLSPSTRTECTASEIHG